MAPQPLLRLTIAVFVIAVLYQKVFHNKVFVALGVGRHHQTIDEFPQYKCKRLVHPLLESCEDIVIDEVGRKVYAACSSSQNRRAWTPCDLKFNTTARQGHDHISVLSLDNSEPLSTLSTLRIPSAYQSAVGGQDIDLHGFSILPLSSKRLRFQVINHRPPIGQDAYKYGTNSTIEIFDLEKGSTKLEFVKTISSEALMTPNNLVGLEDGSILITNDHTRKVGKAFRFLELFIGGGFVTFCGNDGNCHMAAHGDFNFANGITRDKDGLFYVANSGVGTITVLAMHEESKTLIKFAEINTGMPNDNLSLDSNGDIWAAGFPSVIALAKSAKDSTIPVGSTAFRIRKIVTPAKEGEEEDGPTIEWEVQKVIEDINGDVLPGSTVVAHDVKTGNLWMGGITSDFITLCEKV